MIFLYLPNDMISIILCTYNRAHLLPRAIRSVLNQRWQEWELIVIDDGSSDGTRAVVRQFQSKDKRILYHFQTNKGLARARNEGIRRARGTFLCFVDSDDELREDHLSRRMAAMERHPESDLLYGGMKLIGPRSKHYVVDMTDRTKKIHLSKCHVGGTFFFRRRVLRYVRTFRAIPFGEDFDFFTRVAARCTVRRVKDPTYLYHLEAEERLCDLFTEQLLQKTATPASR